MNRNTHIIAPVFALLGAGAAALVIAGPLDPPAGPIAATYKTLAEVEPRTPLSAATTPGDADSVFKITQSGSYYLTGPLVGQVGKSGIKISVSNVTIDLCGFELTASPTGSLAGIRTTGSFIDFSVSNGTLSNWLGGGVEMPTARGVRLHALRAMNCQTVGLRIGDSGEVRSCFAWNCNSRGIETGDACTISDSQANDGVRHGFVAGNATSLSNCTALGNAGTGFSLDDGCTALNCSARESVEYGFLLGAGATVSNCSAHASGSDGFNVGIGGSASNCVATANWTGIDLQEGATASSCTARVNTGNGFILRADASAIRCTATSNADSGFGASDRGYILECTANRNGTAVDNGAGIHLAGGGTRVEGNHVASNDYGILGNGGPGKNIIIRNTSRYNTISNYYHLAGDDVGPIGTAVTATRPYANISVD